MTDDEQALASFLFDRAVAISLSRASLCARNIDPGRILVPNRFKKKAVRGARFLGLDLLRADVKEPEVIP